MLSFRRHEATENDLPFLAAWKFYEENRHTLSYDLSVVAPAWIFGVRVSEPVSHPLADQSLV